MSLSFYEDLGRAAKQDDKNKAKNKRGKKRKDHEDPRQMKENDKKRSRQELLMKTREEVLSLFENNHSLYLFVSVFSSQYYKVC